MDKSKFKTFKASDLGDEVISEEERVKIDGYDDMKYKYEEIVRKYKERFTSGVDKKEDIIEDAGDDLEEKEVIDIKEI